MFYHFSFQKKATGKGGKGGGRECKIYEIQFQLINTFFFAIRFSDIKGQSETLARDGIC